MVEGTTALADVQSEHSAEEVKVSSAVDATDVENSNVPTACTDVTYEAFATINSSDGAVKTGYILSSGNNCEGLKEDKTSNALPSGTKTEIRETTASEQEQFGKSNVVIVDDITLTEKDLIIGEK